MFCTVGKLMPVGCSQARNCANTRKKPILINIIYKSVCLRFWINERLRVWCKTKERMHQGAERLISNITLAQRDRHLVWFNVHPPPSSKSST